jgi:hypothetical protein
LLSFRGDWSCGRCNRTGRFLFGPRARFGRSGFVVCRHSFDPTPTKPTAIHRPGSVPLRQAGASTVIHATLGGWSQPTFHARANGKPALLWKRPGLPRDWVRVLERHPEGVNGLPGYVWLDMPGKVRSVNPSLLEFRDGVADR